MTCGIVGFPQSEPSLLTLFVGGVDFLNHHTFVRSDLESKQERKVIWGITFGSSWIATLNILADIRCYPFFPCETEWLAGRTWPKKKKSLMEWVKEKLDHDGFYRWKRSNTDTNWASVKIGENKLNVFVWNETVKWKMLMLVPILASVSSSEYLVTLITRLIYFPSPYSCISTHTHLFSPLFLAPCTVPCPLQAIIDFVNNTKAGNSRHYYCCASQKSLSPTMNAKTQLVRYSVLFAINCCLVVSMESEFSKLKKVWASMTQSQSSKIPRWPNTIWESLPRMLTCHFSLKSEEHMNRLIGSNINQTFKVCTNFHNMEYKNTFFLLIVFSLLLTFIVVSR